MSDTRITLDTTVVAAPSQVSTRVSDEAVILNLRDGVYYGLESVGARVWEALGEPRPVREIRDALVAEFDVEAERCERDLVELLAELHDRGLVEVRDASAA
ncbi:MAG TPA: PqqD family peptide modification chaperone [Longimicrobiaceae bacterium]